LFGYSTQIPSLIGVHRSLLT